jgi:hypothetical protein
VFGTIALAIAGGAATPRQDSTALRTTQAGFAAICSGKGGAVQLRFTDANGDFVEMARTDTRVTVHREVQPESADWLLKDMYLFSRAGKRLQFSRSITYASHAYAYVQITDSAGRMIDNGRALPDPYLTEEPVVARLQEICRIKPRKAQ